MDQLREILLPMNLRRPFSNEKENKKSKKNQKKAEENDYKIIKLDFTNLKKTMKHDLI